MPRQSTEADLLPGALEMLILKTLTRGPNHGYGIAKSIQAITEDALRIGEGSLYPALQRLLVNEWVTDEWGVSEANRKARIYKVTPAGRKQLVDKARGFQLQLAAIAKVMA